MRVGLGKLKHLDIKWLWIQQKVQEKALKGTVNDADLLTKAFVSATVIEDHKKRLGLIDLPGRNEKAPELSISRASLKGSAELLACLLVFSTLGLGEAMPQSGSSSELVEVALWIDSAPIAALKVLSVALVIAMRFAFILGWVISAKKRPVIVRKEWPEGVYKAKTGEVFHLGKWCQSVNRTRDLCTLRLCKFCAKKTD